MGVPYVVEFMSFDADQKGKAHALVISSPVRNPAGEFIVDIVLSEPCVTTGPLRHHVMSLCYEAFHSGACGAGAYTRPLFSST